MIESEMIEPLREALKNLPDYLKKNGEGNTAIYIQSLRFQCDNKEKLQKEFIVHALSILDQIMDESHWIAIYALYLPILMISPRHEVFKKEIVAHGLRLLSKTAGEDAEEILSKIAQLHRIPISAFTACVGTLPGETKIAVSGPGGSVFRPSIALRMKKASRHITVFHAGCFTGSANQLLEASSKTHGAGTENNIHYRNFIAFAQQALEAELPDFVEAMQARITAAQMKPA